MIAIPPVPAHTRRHGRESGPIRWLSGARATDTADIIAPESFKIKGIAASGRSVSGSGFRAAELEGERRGSIPSHFRDPTSIIG